MHIAVAQHPAKIAKDNIGHMIIIFSELIL